MENVTANSAAAPLPLKANSAYFYRYGEFAGEKRGWLKEIILGHRLYIPKLSQLNDPSDGRPRLASNTEDQLYSFLYDSVLSGNPHMTTEDQVREAVILDANLRHHGVEPLMRQMAGLLNSMLEDWRVYSLCKRSGNLNMWAKYSCNHTGYCLEFANEGPFFNSAKEVRYQQSVGFELTNPAHRSGYWFFCKTPEWSNEEEARILVTPSSDASVRIDPCWLTRVILGWKMSREDQVQIREWASSRSPQLTVAAASYDELNQVLRIED